MVFFRIPSVFSNTYALIFTAGVGSVFQRLRNFLPALFERIPIRTFS